MRGRLIESSPHVTPWREAVKMAVMLKYPAGTRMSPVMIAGPVKAEISFFLNRPKKPKYLWPHGTPDLDKLLRSTFDAMKECGVYEDDSRVVSVTAHKLWSELQVMPGARITISSAMEPAE